MAQENRFLEHPHYGGTESEFLETQQWQTLDLVDKTLDANPVQDGDPCGARKMALFALDGIVHNSIYDNTPAIRHYMEGRLEKVLQKMDEPVSNGLRVFKIYNMGFVLKTASMTVAIDLSSQEGARFPLEIADRIADRCDALFITHNHNDHFDNHVVDRFLSQRKPVVAPTEYRPENREIIHRRPQEGKTLDGKLKLNGKTLKYRLLPGHQNITETTCIMCNHIGLMFPEGYTTVHLGDQAHPEDNSWMKNAREMLPGVDILFSTCWMGDLGVIIPGYDPRTVIVGHENELGHGITVRIPYWYAYHNYAGIGRPLVVMGWGEVYDYKRE